MYGEPEEMAGLAQFGPMLLAARSANDREEKGP